MPFNLQAMGLGQFGRGGPGIWERPPQPQQPPWMTGPEVEPPGGYTDAWWNSLDPREQAWRESQAVRENWGNKGQPRQLGGFDPQRMPPVPGQPTTGPSYDDYVRGGGGFMPPMGQGQMPPMGQQMPWQQGFNPTQQRHNAWLGQHGGMAPLSQYSQFGQGGGWGGMMGGLAGAFGLRR